MTLRRWLLRPLGAAACALFIYWMSAAVCMFLTSGRNMPQDTGNIDVFLVSNGIHVDLVVPVATAVADWRAAGLVRRPATRYLALSWGERDFFLNTPTWADFDPLLGLEALLWQSDVLMHVTELRAAPAGDTSRLALTPVQYRRLSGYIRRTVGQPRLLPGKGYGAADDFYVASGTYSPFVTCNEWVNRALRSAGLRAALWSPLPWGVMRRRGS